PYNFGLPSSSTLPHPVSGPPIDPRLIPLPEDDDLDLSDPAAVAKSRGLKPAAKIAGARHKGKKRQHSPDLDESDLEPVPKKGRPKGSPNFSDEDVSKLLDAVQKVLPLGQKGWKAVTHRYQKWARTARRPERDAKSLEAKYKAILKQKKPTGSASCPPAIKRAHRIETMINERADTRELHDSDVADEGDASSDDSIEVLDAVARRAPSPPLCRNPRMNAPELVNKLSHAFDPDTQRARDEERSQRSFQSAQIFAMSQQLRDAQAIIETLRNRAHDAERARDRAELRLELAEGRGHRSKSERRSKKVDQPDLIRVNGKVRCETVYPEGGQCTYWVTDASSDESEKENKDPKSSSPSRTSSTFFCSSPSASSRSSQLHRESAFYGELPSAGPPTAQHMVAGPPTPADDVMESGAK
ncbi:hypothetical protein B0H15DRAFT_777771, partial [Mycena belliarum]